MKKGKITVKLNPTSQIIKRLGLDPAGYVQKFHTANVLRRIKRYMPAQQGSGLTYKITVAQTDINKPEIVTKTPYAEYLFEGEKMIDPKINASGFMTPNGWRSRKNCVKVRTGKPLRYTKKPNPRAGPHWDRALSAAEGKAMAADLQRYIDRKAGKK